MNWLIGLLCFCLLLSLLGWYRSSTKMSRGNRRRQRRAVRGETEAELFLIDQGYTIVGRQVSQRWTLWIDEQSYEATSRADLWVERDGQSYIAEVKTGARATNPKHSATRRQLLEYVMVFDVDGVLLVDMESRTVGQVSFEWPEKED